MQILRDYFQLSAKIQTHFSFSTFADLVAPIFKILVFF
jgi:hypothetical protein